MASQGMKLDEILARLESTEEEKTAEEKLVEGLSEETTDENSESVDDAKTEEDTDSEKSAETTDETDEEGTKTCSALISSIYLATFLPWLPKA